MPISTPARSSRKAKKTPKDDLSVYGWDKGQFVDAAKAIPGIREGPPKKKQSSRGNGSAGGKFRGASDGSEPRPKIFLKMENARRKAIERREILESVKDPDETEDEDDQNTLAKQNMKGR